MFFFLFHTWEKCLSFYKNSAQVSSLKINSSRCILVTLKILYSTTRKKEKSSQWKKKYTYTLCSIHETAIRITEDHQRRKTESVRHMYCILELFVLPTYGSIYLMPNCSCYAIQDSINKNLMKHTTNTLQQC